MTTISKFLIITVLTISSSSIAFGQSKKELRKQIDDLKSQITQTEKEKETVRARLNRISDIKVDEVITSDKLPKDIIIGEGGWRIELNAFKYKSDLIGQLGTIWVVDSDGLLQPQGAIILSDYKIDPTLTNRDKDVIYKSFVSSGSKLEGDGGAPFAKLAASIQSNQYSRFTINIEGTSSIKIQIPDLQKIATLANQLFDVNKNKGVYICTGMHVIKYHSAKYSKSDGNAKITSPVVNIGGEFYAESSEENTEYFVARQLTQLNKPVNKTPAIVNSELNTLLNTSSETNIINQSKKYSPEQILTFILKREPTFEEIVEFQNNPDKFLKDVPKTFEFNNKERLLIDNAKLKLNELPKEIKSIDNFK